ncbi:Phosphonate C-P lyase system protein PhnH [Devosia sp. LC5]|uniref:phosphonate C-P lyase system protein PhnH n=1 Tax=Devosia sp. LC5 TaxID=1502724 RepID=UPI0004E2A5F6|nr:phosphonate C-P lyase system protein PhnH [Devosia sp. LC5]KFC67401.1 Phosphonate C-P lyase system protein PhnH [Devosia sp. LC5]
MDNLMLDGGFADPVMQAQQGFRALMDALANPGTIQQLALGLTPPAPLTPELAAVLLTLCDHDTGVWLEPDLATEAVTGWLRFHIGSPLNVARDQAQFAVLRDSNTLQLNGFSLGTDIYPDRSTTVIVAVPALSGGDALVLKGPGIEHSVEISPLGLPGDFLEQWAENRAQFPRGVDLLLVADGAVIGLPRTTRISGKDA